MIAIREALRAGLFARDNLIKNIFAGLVVGIVALPLAMAFAIASGARPENGLYTAIVAGLCVALFGGTRIQIAGPTGAFIVILANITGQYGFAGLQVATFMAGGILILMGLLRLGSVIKFIPEPVIAGFTSGIGVIIFVGQWKDFFGLPVHLGIDAKFHTKLMNLATALPHLSLMTTLLAILSILLVIYAHKIKYLKVLPGPLVAMLVATALQTIFKFDGVATLGSVFGHIPRGIPPFQMMELSLDNVTALIGPAFTIALLGAIESLLSATAADGLAGGGLKHRPNQELVGQGIANCISPLFGGFAATGAIARTATNIRNGGNSPLAAIVHSVFLLAVILLLAPLAEYVPLCSLAAILFVVAYNMSDVRHFVYILKHSPRDGKIVLLVTFLLTVFADLVVAVNVGVILAMMLTMRRITITTNVQQEVVDEDDVAHINNQFKRNVIVYAINGPLFFAITEKFAESLANTHNLADAVVFKLKAVPFIDFSGLSAFQETLEKLHRQKITIYLYGVNPQISAKFAEVGLLKLVETSSVFYSMLQIVKYDNSLSVNADSDSGVVNKSN